MNERHLFRGKRVDRDVWDLGYLSWHESNKNPKAHLTIVGNESGRVLYNEIIPETIGQCTEIPDEVQKDKFLYEGDIVKQIGNDDIFVIKWRSDREYTGWNAVPIDELDYAGHFPIGYNQDFYAVGNIHDNPELMEVQNSG